MLITTLKGRFIVHVTQMSMNIGTYECIVSKLDIRQFKDQEVSNEIRLKILEAGRQSGTGLNTEHLRFVLVDHKDVLKLLAEDRYEWKLDIGSQFCNNCSYKSELSF